MHRNVEIALFRVATADSMYLCRYAALTEQSRCSRVGDREHASVSDVTAEQSGLPPRLNVAGKVGNTA